MEHPLKSLVCMLLPLMPLMAEQGIGPGKKITTAHYEVLDINEIECYIQNTGPLINSPFTGGSGLFYPKGQRDKSIIYDAGLWVIGRMNGELRTAVRMFRSEFQPGAILPNGTADDPDLEKYRVYKYNRGDAIDAEAIAQGCPEDVLGDQMCFCVFNDVCSHAEVFQTAPIGLEVQMTVFAFNRTGALGKTLFVRYHIINKNADGLSLDSAYVGLWFDTDLGDPSDDSAGCDPESNLAFAYNGDDYDHTYGNGPPAIGSDLLQGPVVPALGESVLFPDGTVKLDHRLLPMTAFYFFINGTSLAGFSDPNMESYAGAVSAYHFLTGHKGNGEPWVDPFTGQATPLPYSGDPVSGSGWINPHHKNSRMGQSSGPFELKAGESQTLHYALSIGDGKTNLTSIEHMRLNNRVAQDTYAHNYQLPDTIPVPRLQTTARDGAIVLSWDEAATGYADLGAAFEGYNVWMAACADGPWTRVSTLDLENGLTTIWAPVLDDSTGSVVSRPVQFGTDAGVRHDFTIDYDHARDKAMANGREYWFAVTAYAVRLSALNCGLPGVEETERRPMRATSQLAEVTSAAQLKSINVFPNPYFGKNADERGAYEQFVTFSNLPATDCTLRIFTLSGQQVIVLKHNNGTPFERWDLLNTDGRPVASGMHIVHIQTAYGSRVLKLGVVNRQLGFPY